MANIFIISQVVVGNVGDGREDQNAAELARYTEERWRQDLASMEAEGHRVTVDVEPMHDTSSCTMGPFIHIDKWDPDLYLRVKQILTPETTIREDFYTQ